MRVIKFHGDKGPLSRIINIHLFKGPVDERARLLQNLLANPLRLFLN